MLVELVERVYNSGRLPLPSVVKQSIDWITLPSVTRKGHPQVLAILCAYRQMEQEEIAINQYSIQIQC